LPPTSSINPILSSLCDVNGPPSFQASGFDVIAAYWENPEATVVETADRLSFLSLFLGSNVPWAMDLWEPRFKALRALTKYGTDIVGIENALINVVKWWIEGAFDGILRWNGEIDRAERSERERSLDVLVKFLSDVLNKTENIARFSEDTIPSVLQFYASLVDRSIIAPESPYGSNDFSVSTDSLASTSQPKFALHRRNLSSLSTTSLTSPTTPIPPPISQISSKQPSEIAITIYLGYLQSQIKTLSPLVLQDILPVLFRALASCASPLPRLTVLSHPHKRSSLEDRVIETLTSVYTGPYSTTCLAIHKDSLSPRFEEEGTPSETNDVADQASESGTLRPTASRIPWVPLQLGILTSLGAHRMLRSRVRHVLIARLARAYILRESSVGYSHSGAPSHIDVEQDLMEKAWPRDDYPNTSIGISSGSDGWDARRIGPAFAESIGFWIDWIGEGPHTPTNIQPEESFKESWDRERQKADQILQEAAGLLKDILQEVDSREEDESDLTDDEATFVGEALSSLCKYVPPLRRVVNSGIAIPLTDSL
jgi:hypothetical protein